MSSQPSKPTTKIPTTATHSQYSPREDLLDELQSLKNLLADASLNEAELDADLDIDIPILDDVVAEDATEKPVPMSSDNGLLDLDTIFDDDDILSRNDTLVEHIEETQLNFDNLDIGVEIPAFKLSLSGGENHRHEAISASTNNAETVTVPQSKTIPVPAPLTDLALPDDLTLPPTPFATPLKPLYTAVVTATNNLFDAQTRDDVPAEPDLPSPSTETLIKTTIKTTTAATTTPMATEVDIHLLIQEIVDEVIPLVEDRLRQRLSVYPADVIRQLAQKHLKN